MAFFYPKRLWFLVFELWSLVLVFRLRPLGLSLCFGLGRGLWPLAFGLGFGLGL